MTDDVKDRLRAADPMHSSARRAEPAHSWVSDLVSATVRTPTKESGHPPARRRWIAAGAVAAASIVAIAVGGFAVLSGGDDDATPVARTTMNLSLPAQDTSSPSCLPFSIDILAGMPIAFSGTAVEVGDSSVLLEVDHWYRGGEQDQVRLEAPNGETVSLDGIVNFVAADRYLVTAANGVVNACGFTAKWTAETAAAFERAFGG